MNILYVTKDANIKLVVMKIFIFKKTNNEGIRTRILKSKLSLDSTYRLSICLKLSLDST